VHGSAGVLLNEQLTGAHPRPLCRPPYLIVCLWPRARQRGAAAAGRDRRCRRPSSPHSALPGSTDLRTLPTAFLMVYGTGASACLVAARGLQRAYQQQEQHLLQVP
jgi:hypothetical protein